MGGSSEQNQYRSLGLRPTNILENYQWCETIDFPMKNLSVSNIKVSAGMGFMGPMGPRGPTGPMVLMAPMGRMRPVGPMGPIPTD